MTVRRFALRVFLWLPACFAAWHLAAPFQAQVTGWLAQGLLAVFQHGLVESVGRDGSVLTFVLGVESGPAAASAVLAAEINAAAYMYGTPLFAALMLASRGGIAKLACGILALLPLQAGGIALDFLAQLIREGSAAAGLAGLLGWRAEAVALAYQFGSLVLPGLAPIVLWATLHRKFIARHLASPMTVEATPG
jgi:hypothetical protein